MLFLASTGGGMHCNECYSSSISIIVVVDVDTLVRSVAG